MADSVVINSLGKLLKSLESDKEGREARLDKYMQLVTLLNEDKVLSEGERKTAMKGAKLLAKAYEDMKSGEKEYIGNNEMAEWLASYISSPAGAEGSKGSLSADEFK